MRNVKQELEIYVHTDESEHTANQVSRAAAILLEKTIKDKVFSVFSLANDLFLNILTNFIKKNR